MGTWTPPIPAGTFSNPAIIRKLGAGMGLLAWCYDNVRTSGWVEVSLTEIASDLETPYHTVKKWWSALRELDPWAEVEDRGRRGFRVRFREDWVDWRGTDRTPEPAQEPPAETVKDSSRNAQGPYTVLETQEETLKDSSRYGEGPSTVLEDPAYKVLMSDHESSLREGARSAPPPPPAPRRTSSRRDRPPPDPNQDHPAARLYFAETGYRPSRDQARDMAEGYTRGGRSYAPVDDLALWREAIREVRRQKAGSQNVGWMLDLYHAPERLKPREASHATNQRGGYRGSAPRPALGGIPSNPDERQWYLDQIEQWEREAAAENIPPSPACAAA